MLVQSVSYSNAYLNQRKHFAMERGPRMLKDCLLEDSNTCSSNGFKSFPRRPIQRCPVKPQRESNMNTTTLKKKKRKEGESSQRRSRTLQAVINAVKSFQFNAVITAPSILPRSLSRRLSKKEDKKETKPKAEVTVRVKDIVQWRSSVDLNEDVSTALDFKPSPPQNYVTTAAAVTTAAGSTTTTSSTRCSSWCDSDFTTSEFSASCGGNSEHGDIGADREKIGKKELPCVGGDEDSTEAMAATVADTQVGPTDLPCEEQQNHCSPVSILDLQYEEDDQASDSSFSQSLDNVERTNRKLMQKIKRFESLAKISPLDLDKWMSVEEDSCTEGGQEADINADAADGDDDDYDGCDGGIDDDDDDDDDEAAAAAEEESDEFEEKAVQLWNQVKEGCAMQIHDEHLVMDFFRDELSRRLNSHHETYRHQAFENELVAQAKAWIQREKVSDIEHGSTEHWRKACISDVEREDGNWKWMEEEREEVGIEVEDEVLNLLTDEMLTDLYLC